MKPQDADNAEEAVGQYLRALADPGVVYDDERLAEYGWLEEPGGDVIERLRARQELLDLQDGEQRLKELEQRFVRHAKAWADQHGLSAEVFRAEGVRPRVLNAAGWRDRRSPGRQQPTRSRSRVTAVEVWNAIPEDELFTLRWLREETGASSATVRKVVTDEIQAGHIVEQGQAPDHTGRGRPPTLYRWVGE